MTIYTLDYIFKEAGEIATYWNGSDERFIDCNGDNRTDEEAQVALEVMETIKDLRGLLNRLGI
jgi:hypothetical protein